MNELFRTRRNHTLLSLGVTLGLWLIYRQFLGGTAVLALMIAAAMVTVVSGALLLVLRGEALRPSECLTALGGLLASLYGRDK